MKTETAADHKIIICPAIYKHFKGKYYATMGISEPIEDDVEFFSKIDHMSDNIKARHTESGFGYLIYVVEGKYYHEKRCDKGKVIIYKSLYDDLIPYCRPISMFLSEVDKEKYPNINQKFRFKLVRY